MLEEEKRLSTVSPRLLYVKITPNDSSRKEKLRFETSVSVPDQSCPDRQPGDG